MRVTKETGFVRRHRTVDPAAFFWAVTLEAGVYLQRSLEPLRFVHNPKTPKPLDSYASFYDRFTLELVEFLLTVVVSRRLHLAVRERIKKEYRARRDSNPAPNIGRVRRRANDWERQSR